MNLGLVVKFLDIGYSKKSEIRGLLLGHDAINHFPLTGNDSSQNWKRRAWVNNLTFSQPIIVRFMFLKLLRFLTTS